MFYAVKSNKNNLREKNNAAVRFIDRVSPTDVLFGYAYACDEGNCYYDKVYDYSRNGIRKYSLDKLLDKQMIEKDINEKSFYYC